MIEWPDRLMQTRGWPVVNAAGGYEFKSVGQRSFHTFGEIISYSLIFWPELDLGARDTEG